jgi:predicted dienelactone hydrolase
MSYRKRLVLTVFILLVLSALFMGGMVQEKEAVASTGLDPDAAPYSVRGPHLVGTRDLVIDGETPLEITVWYPALKLDDNEEPITYPYEIKVIAPLGASAIATFEGQAGRNAPYDLPKSPYPLVILSPGFAIGSTTYAWLAEHLASYGFVVISPEHDEHLVTAMSELWQSAITRPQDILTVLAYTDKQVGTGGTFEGLINTELVAVIGHSYGGYTALAAAGAQLDTDDFESRCATVYETSDPNAWLCDALLPHVADMAQLAGLDSIPEGLWPAWADSRVDAIVSMAGDAYLFDQAGLAEVAVPVMAIGGTRDSDTPYMWGTHPTFEFASSPKKVRIALNDAGHMIFTGRCEAIRRLMKIVPNTFCSDPVWDRNRAHDLTNHFTAAFLLAELKKDTDAATALMPDTVEFSGVTYETQGY